MRRSGVSDSTKVNGSPLALLRHGKHQAILDDRQIERIGAVVAAFQLEPVALEDVEDRHLALVLDVGVGAADGGFVEVDGNEPGLGVGIDRGLEHGRASGLAAAGRQADRNRAAVRFQPLGARKRHGGRAERCKRLLRRA